MKLVLLAAFLLVLLGALAQPVAMLPPDTFQDPIFAHLEAQGDDGDSDAGEYTEFA